MFCKYCGATINADMTTCSSCGALIEIAKNVESTTEKADSINQRNPQAYTPPDDAYDSQTYSPSFCVHCGNKLNKGACFCPNCGSAIEANLTFNNFSGTNNLGSNKAISPQYKMYKMIVAFLAAILTFVSVFVYSYYIEIINKHNFSVFSVVNETSELLGSRDPSSLLDFEDMSQDEVVLSLVFITVLIMALIGALELLVALSYMIKGTSPEVAIKYYKAIFSSSLCVFVAHFILFAAILIKNYMINDELGTKSLSLFGVNPTQYLFQIVAIISFVNARKEYRKLK